MSTYLIPYREKRNHIANPLYASVNTLLGIEQSRRDDLESLGYALMYFLRGSLPWQGLKDRTKKQKIDDIIEMKVSKIEVLCESYPSEFLSYFHYCRSLRFDDKPDYKYLKRLFRDLFIREGYQFDYIFDWTILKDPHIGSSSRERISAEAEPAAAEPSVGQEMQFSGAFPGVGEASFSINTSGSGPVGEHSRHRTPEDGPSSKDVQDTERDRARDDALRSFEHLSIRK
ncbi:unnamed protein product [Rhodiola kirilowii]